ncbi:MAG: group 1 truncated hemoglobin [Nitrospira sp.]|jgi:hemoglobin|nr:group 1 truncated hemoglobin [Nitrospira sp.]HQY56239.1 group 1 truncated hemoglobin [Nitrospira sp.]HRA95628.1 group 1 truncated hemoglobin [Nitrospira sp.]HRC45065.1 group 1 truncated hemoglobin [Nitrospira sp.]
MMVTKNAGMGVLVLSALAVLAGCADTGSLSGAGQPVAGATATKSLYDRLGGKPAITAVVDQFVANVAADGRINSRFATTDIPKLKGHLVDQVCSATGGPCSYRGRDMKSMHLGMRISSGDFGALVQDLVAALDKFNVPAGEKGELLGLLGPMKKDIVEVP